MAKLCDVYCNDAFGTAHRAEATTHGIAQVRAGRLRRPAAGGRARRARQGARASRAPAGRDRRRLEGLDQAHGAESAGREGRPADRRRRHRQHVHPRRARARRQVAGRSRSGRRSAGDPRCIPRQGADPDRRRVREGILRRPRRRRSKAIEDVERRRHDPRHRPDDGGGAEDDHRQGGHHRLERAGRRVRVRRVRGRHQGARRGDRGIVTHSRSPAAATPSPPSTNSASPTGSRYISTAGGAFLEFLEGKTLPAVAVLEARAAG